jgi:hypothetical protein
MNKEEIFKEIISKRDFSKIPEKDIWLAYRRFEKRQCSEEEKIRLTRDLLRKVYSAFTSEKLLSIKDKPEEWFLRKHLSTRERQACYPELYKKIIFPLKKCSVLDLGSGINGFSYKYFPKHTQINYLAIEAVGQLVDLMNFHFKKKKLNAEAIHESLFNLEEIKRLIEKSEGPRVIFLFKILDSLEMIERDYSKKLLREIVPLVDKVIVSFATQSMIKREKFKVNRNWIIVFIRENFELLEDFYLGNERYITFKPR